MMSPLRKKITTRAFMAAVLTLLIIAGVVAVVLIVREPGATVSAEDLAEMKTLALKYLNERNRVLVSSDPDSNQNLNVSMIEPGEMTEQVAERQKVDIEKLRQYTKSLEDQGIQYWNHFDTEVEVFKTTSSSDKTVLRISELTRLYFLPGMGPVGEIKPEDDCSGFEAERDFTFVRRGGKWVISDVILPFPGWLPPPNEPSVEPET